MVWRRDKATRPGGVPGCACGMSAMARRGRGHDATVARAGLGRVMVWPFSKSACALVRAWQGHGGVGERARAEARSARERPGVHQVQGHVRSCARWPVFGEGPKARPSGPCPVRCVRDGRMSSRWRCRGHKARRKHSNEMRQAKRGRRPTGSGRRGLHSAVACRSSEEAMLCCAERIRRGRRSGRRRGEAP